MTKIVDWYPRLAPAALVQDMVLHVFAGYACKNMQYHILNEREAD